MFKIYFDTKEKKKKKSLLQIFRPHPEKPKSGLALKNFEFWLRKLGRGFVMPPPCIQYTAVQCCVLLYTQAQRGLLSTAIPFITVDWLIIQIIFFLFLVVNVVARSVPRARGYTIVVQLDALSLYVFSPALLVLRIVSLTTVFF